MTKNIFEIVEETLRTNSKYISNDGKLLKAIVYSDVMTMNKELLNLLLSNEKIKERFFQDVNGTLVFDKQGFAWFVESKEFLPDSYTRYTNKIGLTNNGNFISTTNDVVLDFPYKDCVLEGGQDKDDQKRNEIFYNETIASDEITKMLAPKVFTKAKRYTKDSIEENITFNENDNLIIKGNNLIVLSSLLKRYEGKVKCIYIDPPYNTGNDSFNYNDRFNHSTWLVFMKNRLELAKRLLRDDGVIFVQCDDNEQAYLKVLMDEIFGRDNFYGNIVQLKGTTQNDSKKIQKNHEYILCYSKNNKDLLVQYTNYAKKKIYEDSYYLGRDSGASSGDDRLIDRNNLGYTIYYFEGDANQIDINEIFKKNNKSYNSFNFFFEKDKSIIKHAIAIEDYDKENININSQEKDIYFDDEYLINLGYVPIRPPKRKNNILGRWTWGINNFKELWNNNKVIILENKKVIKKEYISNENIIEEKSVKYCLIGNELPFKSYIDISSTLGTKEINQLFGMSAFSFPKSEELLKILIDSSTKKNDLVLDFHLGSGTTAAVAHKMGRRYIGIEQMDYMENITVERMKKVINGEQGGISKTIEWQGGGSFVYCELLENANTLIEKIQLASEDTISEIKNEIYADERIIPYITRAELEKVDEEFASLKLEDKKKVLISLVDKNKLYLNYSDMEDEIFNVTEEDKNFTKLFYKEV
ncbi:site-specific DNA-methyltransferase [Mycoplasmopsis synoviae]|uniref:DNA methyltransferase n=1 Tax=Mycoplasmopsis synoviae TaxID=2109 RepID=UPI001CE123B0|nr:site-specific DNA-methyltransferase [Mycoplasmopsis synoviae]UBX97190.1 site-specific DNA-methyltransferase [Mycoplasmopsis synoviae]UBX98399.1 site-specific DNA-methyltransferase [Mycoplasmopsis synoviae]UBX98820.1 site-specific DNA-methyltransferase [Mycoplasmopsis synoviae]